MTSLFAYTNSVIFVVLAIFHFYWLFGGKWGLQATIPAQWHHTHFAPERRRFVQLATLGVAFALLLCSAVMLALTMIITLPDSLHASIRIAGWLIAILFGARAIGDFKYIGFFKPMDDSLFARRDRQLFSPLCLWLAISTSWILLSI